MTNVLFELTMRGDHLHEQACEAANLAYRRDLLLEPMAHPDHYVVALVEGAVVCTAGFHLAGQKSILFIDRLAGNRASTHSFLHACGTSYLNRHTWAEITCVGAVNSKGRRLIRHTLGQTFCVLESLRIVATLNVLTAALSGSLDKNGALRHQLCDIDRSKLPIESDPAWWHAFVQNYLDPPGREPSCTGISVEQAAKSYQKIQDIVPGRFTLEYGVRIAKLLSKDPQPGTT